MGITTKSGDQGRTVDFRGQEVSKAAPSVELSGAFDSAETALGFAATCAYGWQAGEAADAADKLSKEYPMLHLARALCDQQRTLFAAMRDITGAQRFDADGSLQAALEEQTASLNAHFNFTGFVLPGGCELAARLDLARVSVRACERAAVAASESGLAINPAILTYLNRLSDFLFLAARQANADSGVKEQLV